MPSSSSVTRSPSIRKADSFASPTHQVDVLASAVLGDPQKIDNADREYGIDLDFTFLHSIALAHRNPWALPDADTASDLTLAHAFAQPFRKGHRRTLLHLVLHRRARTR